MEERMEGTGRAAPVVVKFRREHRRSTMNAGLVFGLFLAAAVAFPTLPAQPRAAEDPCAFARQIAESQPCVKQSDCKAMEMWRGMYGAPRSIPADTNVLAPQLEARLRAMGLEAHREGNRWVIGRSHERPEMEPHAGSYAPSFNCPAR